MKTVIILLLSFFMTKAIADEKWVAQVTDSHNYLNERQDALIADYSFGHGLTQLHKIM